MSHDVAASIRARLLVLAKARGEEFELTLTRFANERLLFRLGSSAVRDRCLLKGACLLAAWLPDPYRATRDIDILATGPVNDEAVRSLVTKVCSVPCHEDGLRFDLSNLVIETIRPEEEYSGKRSRFLAWLGNARISLQVDIGVGDAVVLKPEEITYPTMLPGLPPPRLRAYPKEVTIAEKFEAMVKFDTRNSRMKDFHDTWALASTFTFDGPALQKSIAACFERRATPWSSEVPRVLTAAFYRMPEIEVRWRQYLAVRTVLTPPPKQFDIIGSLIIAFLGPVRKSILQLESFDHAWAPGGSWTSPREKNPR